MRTRTFTAILAAGAVAVGTLAGLTPAASATTPMAKKSTGKVVVNASYYCKVTLKAKGKSLKVPKSGVVKNVTPGTYKVVAKPSKCKPTKKKVKVKKGKTVKTQVLYDPRQVAKSMSGTITGEEFVDGQSYARWNANVRLVLEEPIGNSSYTNFETLAKYRVTEFNGAWTVDFTTSSGKCSNKGSGTIGIDDLRIDSTGDPDPWWTNPWNNYTYAFEAVTKGEKSWSYTRTCTDPNSVTQQTRGLPFRFLGTNDWDGSDPVPPLNTAGGQPSGTFTLQRGISKYTWTWNLEMELGKSFSKP